MFGKSNEQYDAMVSGYTSEPLPMSAAAPTPTDYTGPVPRRQLFGVQLQGCHIGFNLGYEPDAWHVAGYARITFPDGTTTDARPHISPEYLGHSRRAGYGDAVGAFTVEHELAHAWLAEQLGLPYSQVQWNDAHGVQDIPLIVAEERYVRWWQRWVNTGSDHKGRLQPLLDASLDLDSLKAEWWELVTEVFGFPFWWRELEEHERRQEAS